MLAPGPSLPRSLWAPLADVGRFFTGPGLLVFLFAALGAYEAFLLFTLLWPNDAAWLGQFVSDFQRWCYRPDPFTGGLSWSAVSVMLIEPLFVVGIAAILWRGTVRELGRVATWRRHRGAATLALVAVTGSIAGLVAYARADAAAADILPPFPGERIRVTLPLPDTTLIDQKGAAFSFADLQGQVILVTGVYAACTTTCPPIFEEMRALLTELSPGERAGLRLVALSLNPEYETAELMDAVADARGLSHPEFRYVNGRTPAEMLELLSRLQFARTRDPATGIINHANLFLLVGRDGLIAYRFNLDPRHRAWLREGLRSLLREPHVAAPAA